MSYLPAPEGVDTQAVREWARAFAETAPTIKPETARLIADLLQSTQKATTEQVA